MRVVELSDRWAVAVDIAVWIVVGVGVGYAFHRRPVSAFAVDGRLTRLRGFEADGTWYERRLAIKRWKDRLPEAGALFSGGFSKRDLRGRDAALFDRFVVETRRAELTHWWVLAAAPFFVLWNPPWLAGVMAGYAVAANGPCLLTQRYNRARLLRVSRRLAARGSGGGAPHAGVP